MRIVINADDFGQSDETFEATAECFKAGALTSATIMPNMPATDRAIEFALANPRFGFGVHLTYVREHDHSAERPILAADQLATLCSSDGYFLQSNITRKLALRGGLSVEQIVSETRAQIRKLQAAGIPITHVDSHGHLHKFKPFRQALARVLPELGISRVRTVQTLYLQKPLKSPNFWLGWLWRRQLKALFPKTTDELFLPTSAGDAGNWAEALLDRLASMPSARSIEVGVHPGTAEPWRISERLGTIELARKATSRGHKLVSFAEI